MERVFIDPVIHSRRVERFQVAGMVMVAALVLGAFWMKWLLDDKDKPLHLPVMMSSVVAPALGVGYYMLKRNRRILMDTLWLRISDEGIKSSTPGGTVEIPWSEVERVRVGVKPSRSRTPDLLIKGRGGYVSAFMRWVDRSRPVPESSLLYPGRRFIYPGGERMDLCPENSGLVAAIKERVPAGKIEEGVLTTL